MLNVAEDILGWNKLTKLIYYRYHLFDCGPHQKNTIHLTRLQISKMYCIY